jgi:hypothetical protein
VTEYQLLLAEWAGLAKSFAGWSLNDIKELSPRERFNWLAIAKEYGFIAKD